jgi:long-subunit acyl-CoA synthetase (AMP-forming)
MLSTWAKSQTLEYWDSREFGKQVHAVPFLLFLARKLLGKAHVALGFDRCRAFFASAAPIEVKILKYFTSLDVPIMGTEH